MNPVGSTRLFVATAVAILFCASAQPSLAQDDISSPPRAEVKAQTRAANKAGELLPAGEGVVPQKPVHSSKTRSERKSETLAAARKGELLLPGEGNFKLQPTPRSGKTRAERKAETLMAAKEGTLLPAGENEYPAKAIKRK